MTTQAFNSGTGRRKTAVARVRLLPGEGEIVINGRSLVEQFGAAIDEAEIRLPFRVTNTDGRYNAMIKVEGGGVTRQAGLLTRDPRIKERKKYGLKRARKAPQYTKR